MSFETEKLAELAGILPAHAGTATYRPPIAPAHVYLLAEHLDTVLAAGEDLMRETFTWNTANPHVSDEVRRERVSLRATFTRVRALELALIARLMRAREHTQTLERSQPRLRLVTQLFLAGTTPFVDAVAEMGDTTRLDFETGNACMAYLRSHGLIGPEDAAPIDGARLPVGEDFLVAKRIALGVLMDLVSHVLDALDVHYELFGDTPSPFAQGDIAAKAPAEAVAAAEPIPDAEHVAGAEADVTDNVAGGCKGVEASVKGLSLTEALASLAPVADAVPVASLSDTAKPEVDAEPTVKNATEPPAETTPDAAKSA